MNNLPRLAELVKARNTVESNIANLIGQPVHIGSVGDYSVSFRLKEEPVNLEGHKRFVKIEGMQVPVPPLEYEHHHI